MPLFRSIVEFFRRCFSKRKVDEALKLGPLLQDREVNTKLERNTGTATESDPGNDIDTQLQSHASKKLSWASIMCRIGLVDCEDCAHRRASTHKRDEHQDLARSGVTISAGPGQRVAVEIVVRVPYQDEGYYCDLPPLEGYKLQLAGAFDDYPPPLAYALAVGYSYLRS
ncbi:hypothetical protein EG329_011677 [Mollisiaceae sp. DMI_Dod_QoI]|nr:hypothetical protein EG329_011677 [Helotiales sp. DMI_Dod_QoI]